MHWNFVLIATKRTQAFVPLIWLSRIESLDAEQSWKMVLHFSARSLIAMLFTTISRSMPSNWKSRINYCYVLLAILAFALARSFPILKFSPRPACLPHPSLNYTINFFPAPSTLLCGSGENFSCEKKHENLITTSSSNYCLGLQQAKRA